MTYLRGIEQSSYRLPTPQEAADDRYHRALNAARGLGAILDALGEIRDFDDDHVDEPDIAELEALQSLLELGLTQHGMRDRVLQIIKQQHRRDRHAKALTVFGETLPKGELR